jgi:acyl-coenzyme A thioesterase PaaI-like protein
MSMHQHDFAPETERRAARSTLAQNLRELIGLAIGTAATTEQLSAAAEQVAAIGEILRKAGVPSYRWGGPDPTDPDRHTFSDVSPMFGVANAIAPPMMLERTETGIVGHAVFGDAYEGPPGFVHGGIVAAAFDEVLGMAQLNSGLGGMTGRLTVHYRKPHPLNVRIAFEGTLDRVDGRKILASGKSMNARTGELLADAEAVFISVDFAKMSELHAARTAAEPVSRLAEDPS